MQHVRQEQPGQQGVPAQPAERQAEDGGEFHVPEAQPGPGQQGQQHVRRARDGRAGQRAEQPAGVPASSAAPASRAEGQQPGDEDQRVGQPQAGQVDRASTSPTAATARKHRQRRVVTPATARPPYTTAATIGPSRAPDRARSRPGRARGRESPGQRGYDEDRPARRATPPRPVQRSA